MSVMCSLTLVEEMGFSFGISRLMKISNVRVGKTLGTFVVYPNSNRNLIAVVVGKDFEESSNYIRKEEVDENEGPRFGYSLVSIGGPSTTWIARYASADIFYLSCLQVLKCGYDLDVLFGFDARLIHALYGIIFKMSKSDMNANATKASVDVFSPLGIVVNSNASPMRHSKILSCWLGLWRISPSGCDVSTLTDFDWK
ncbi:unnamed protein product [Cochlearia groenlandica]